MWKDIPETKYERMLQSSEPILTSGARHEQHQQRQLDAATALRERNWRKKETAHAAEAAAADTYATREMEKLMRGAEGLLTVRPSQKKTPASTASTAATVEGTSSTGSTSGRHRRPPPPPTTASPTPAPVPAAPRRQHFVTGFPAPFADSGFQSVLHWARLSFEEARVVAQGPGSAAEVRRAWAENGGAPPRLLTAVACYLLDEVLRRGGACAPAVTELWEDLRLPILDAIFSPQRIDADLARREQQRQRQWQRQQRERLGVGLDEDDVSACAVGDSRGQAAAEDGLVPDYDTVRHSTYAGVVDFTEYRLWWEDVRSARADNAVLAERIASLTAGAAVGERMLRLTERHHERVRLRALLTAWRAYTRDAQHRRAAACELLLHARERVLEETCFLRWRRITVQAHADRHREHALELAGQLRTQAEAHAQAMQAARVQLQEAAAARETLQLTHETLRCQMTERAEVECGVLRVALTHARERSRLLAVHARRWERLAKTFRPQVLCPAPSAALIAVGRQLRGWEQELAARHALALRVAAAAAASTDRREAAFSATRMRQRAITGVLERFLLRWVNYVMFRAAEGAGEAQARLARLQREHRLLLGRRGGGPALAGEEAQMGFSFWVPVKSLQSHRPRAPSARATAEGKGRRGKGDGESSRRTREAAGAAAVGSPTVTAAAAAAVENSPNAFTLFTLRCLVEELMRQARAQDALASCADANPVLTAEERPAFGPRGAGGETSVGATVGDGEGGAGALGPTGPPTASLVAASPWRAELEAVKYHRSLVDATASSTGAAAGAEEGEATGNQRDGLGLIPYTVRTSSPGGRLSSSSRSQSGRLSHVTPRAGSGWGGGGGARPGSAHGPLTSRERSDAVYESLAQLLVAHSSGGLYPPLLTHARHGPGTPTPTPAQLRHFLFPTDTTACYDHTAMLWVLATLFTGHVRVCHGPEAFLPSAATARTQTREVQPAAPPTAGGRPSPPSPAHVESTGSAPGSGAESTGEKVRTPSPGLLMQGGGAGEPGQPPAAVSLAMPPLGESSPGGKGTSDRRRARRMVSLTSAALVDTGEDPAAKVRLAAPLPLPAARAVGPGGAPVTSTALGTVDDTASDMDVYLGLCDPDVPASDGERGSDEEFGSSTMAVLDTVMTHMATGEEAEMARRRRQRLMSGTAASPPLGEETTGAGLGAGAAPPRRSRHAAMGVPLSHGSEAETTSSSEDKEDDSDSEGEGGHGRGGDSAHAGGAAARHRRRGRRTGRGSQRSADSVADAEDESEASFWVEDPVVEGPTPAPPDRGAESDVSESSETAGPTRLILKHFPHRSRAFDVLPSSGSRSSCAGRGPASSMSILAFMGAAAGAEAEAGLGERTARRRRARRRRRALRAFVDLSIRDRERRQRWLALSRVVTALTTRWYVLDGHVKDGGGWGSGAARGERSTAASDAETEGASHSGGTGAARAPRRSVSRAGSEAAAVEVAPGRLLSADPPADAAAASPAVTASPAATAPGTTADAAEAARSGAGPRLPRVSLRPEPSSRGTAASPSDPDSARPVSYPCFANSGPVAPRPRPRPPSPPHGELGPLDPLVVRPAAPYQPQSSQSSRTHFSLQRKRTSQ